MLKKDEERKTKTPDSDEIKCAVATTDGEEGEDKLPMLILQRSEDSLSDDLTARKRRQVQNLVNEFDAVFSEIPRRTDLVECRQELTAARPVHTKQYPLPHAVRQVGNDEVGEILKMGTIEQSDFAYSSLILVLKKSDGTRRLCIDFLALNGVLTTDAEPDPRVDTLFS
ncbi:polyprotein of retroviral origin, putative [Ixodes scapularis]|uniref:Polyprotein of retroviral origin, putative n=1 Tax=Ixodes scapularis TaxID=6945 RepID=B7QDR6_IXOSC|nr:polyprotein of retroviral origin, putative [Ixodes scapularis]|eukprot:XP_002413680.1 polyprotein of retroviral origin, putative [Ixodes scapularis]